MADLSELSEVPATNEQNDAVAQGAEDREMTRMEVPETKEAEAESAVQQSTTSGESEESGIGAVDVLSLAVMSPPPSAVTFTHLVLVDWEVIQGHVQIPIPSPSVGPDGKPATMGITQSEILEFAWVVYDTQARRPKDSFVRRWITPKVAPLTPEILNSIGLQESEFNGLAKVLREVVAEFDSTIAALESEPRNAVSLVTFGRYKLRDHFKPYCVSQDVPIADYYNSPVDLCEIASRCYPYLSQEELPSPHLVAHRLGVQAEGMRQAGLDCVRTMVNIIGRVLSDGFRITAADVASDKHSPTGLLSAGLPSTYTHLHAHSPVGYPHMSQMQQQVMAPQQQMPAGEIIAVRLRGLPWNSTEKEIVEFLRPAATISPSDIYFIFVNDGSQGRASGECYIQLPSTEVRDRVLRDLNGKHMGKRWIEIFKASEDEVRRFLVRPATQPAMHVAPVMTQAPMTAPPPRADAYEVAFGSNPAAVVRLRGLPWTTNEYEVSRFFGENGVPVSSSQIVLGYSADQRLTGEAWVQLESTSRAEEARRVLNKKMLGRRYIEVFPTSMRELESVLRGSFVPANRYDRLATHVPYGQGGGGGSPAAVPPSQPQVQTLGINEDDHLVRSTQSITTVSMGHGFSQPQSASASLPKRMPVVSSSSSAGGGGHSACASIEGPSVHATFPHLHPLQKPPREYQYGFAVLRLRGLPYTCNEHHIVSFFEGFAMASVLPSTVPIDGKPSGEAYVEFANPDEAWRAFKDRNGGMMERRYIELFPSTKDEMQLAAAGHDPREIRARVPRQY